MPGSSRAITSSLMVNSGAMSSPRRRTLAGFLLVLVLGMVAGLGAPRPVAASAEKSFEITALDSTAVIRPDGSMDVTELVSYRFDGGPFTIGVRSFLAEDRDRITDFEASEDGVGLRVDAPDETPTGEWEWHFPAPVTDETHTYELRYTVPRAVTVGSDVGELYWQFLGTEHEGVDSVAVTIEVPGEFEVATETTRESDAEVLRAWGHGPRQGTVDVLPSTVVLRVTGVGAGRFVEARLAIPAAAFTADATTGPRLPTILEEEGEDYEATLAADRGRSYEPPPSTFARALGPVAALLGLVGAGGIWRRFGREPKPDPLIGTYWREPLVDPPAVVLANRAKGTPEIGRTIGATIIDLAQRGHLTIREEKVEKFGPDEIVHHLALTPGADGPLEPFERRLLGYVFSAGPQTTTEEITTRARANQTGATAFATAFKADVATAYRQRGYEQKKTRGGKWVALLVVGVALVGVVGLALGSALGFVAFGGAIVAGIVAVVSLQNRTQAGADEHARADALEQFLRDFSNLEEAPAGHLILWERFLVFAVTFGVSRALLAGLAARIPQVANDPAFGGWYIGHDRFHRLDTIDRFPSEFGSATAQALVPPSKSGGGGGFTSVGGGGGGGGGGFGAR